MSRGIKGISEFVQVGLLTPHPENPRKNDEAVELIANSIRKFGFFNPVTVNIREPLKNTIVCGHTRYKAARSIGMKNVPVIYVDLSEEDHKLLMIADNKLGEKAQWNFDQLSELLIDLREQGKDLDVLGFEYHELDDLLTDLNVDPFESAEPWQFEPIEIESDLNFTLLKGNCLDKLKELPDNSIDSIVTDPPYELGFMGKSWDSTGIAYSVELWAECLRVLKHGGHLVAFSGSRTVFPMGVAIAEAGFEVRDMISWIYTSGFPKSLDISKAIDKTNTLEPKRKMQLRFTEWMRSTGLKAKQIDQYTDTNMGSHYLSSKSQPAIPTRDLFEKMRPHIPIAVPDWVEEYVNHRTVESENMKKRKVIGQSVSGLHRGSGSTVAFGKGRSRDTTDITEPHSPQAQQWQGWGTALKPAQEPAVLARKPIDSDCSSIAENVLKWGTGAINIDAGRFDFSDTCWIGDSREQKNRIGKLATRRQKSTGAIKNAFGCDSLIDSPIPYFHNSGWWPANVYQCKKPQRSEKEQGLDHLTGKTGAEATQRKEGSDGLNSPRAGAGRTAEHVKNFHPTVKPIKLMRWLCRLLTPQGGTVLDPFLGSGTTAVSAILEGFNAVGCEMTEDYYPIIEGRVNWAKLERENDGQKEQTD